MRITDVRVEYRRNPIGLDVKKPRLSWKMESDEKDTMQSAFRIQVMRKNKVTDEEVSVWDSGKKESDQSVLEEYAGEELLPETAYCCYVTVWDNHGNTADGEASFETGLLNPESMQAQWVTHDFGEEEKACPVFFRRFSTERKIKRARIYATALGLYEIALDGNRVGDAYFTPGWTSYHHRLQYQTYDVTDLLNKGDHCMEIILADGWYKGPFGFMLQTNIYGDQAAVLAELHLLYEDGTEEILKTDDSWQVTTGVIRESQIYYGETIDSTWKSENTPASPVKILEHDKSILTAQEDEPVRITKRTESKELFTTPKGELVLDFGQNMAGFVEVHVKGKSGQKIMISHAEVLDKDGNFYAETLRKAISVDTYICDGSEQIFRPHFTFHGFRYIKVEGMTEEEIRKAEFIACTVHTDMNPTATFTCSNKKVNQLQSNIQWGMRSNFLDIPTDCPQRDERLGWTGDAQIFSWTASLNMNTALFFTKWMRDVAAESSLEKGVPHVVPDILGQYSSSAWSDVAVIVPWVVYQTYGDVRILEENWKCMHEWVDYITGQCGKNGLWQTGFQYGDWLALDKEESADRTGATDKYLIANAYYLYVTELVKKTAEILGKAEDADKYQKLYEKTLEAFRQEYYTPTGRIVSETQTGAVLSLYFNLAKEQDRERIMKTLLTNIENHKNHLATGFVGTPYICHALSENGAHEMAGTLFMKEDYPSWLYAVNMGATTIWERWNSIMPDRTFDESGMNSLNHYAYGSIGDWMYRKVAGLNQLEPGYKRFLVKPMFVKGIEEVHLQYESVYGNIESFYSCRNGKIQVRVVVPANTTAVIILPEKEEEIHVGSGIYNYEYDTDTNLVYERFSMDSTLGEIVEQPLAVEMFNQFVPGMLDGPMIEFAYPMTLSELLGMAPEARPMYEAVIHALNEQENQ